MCLAAFPELSLTGYSIDDLLLGDVLLDEVLAAIETIRAASAGLLPGCESRGGLETVELRHHQFFQQ